MGLERKIKNLIKKYPELRNFTSDNLKNWIEKKRDLDLCSICPDRGLCCYISIYIELPSKELCFNQCPEHLRNKCQIEEESLPKKSKIVNVILDKHPCKFLNTKTNLCNVYENRFRRNRTCQTVRNGIKKSCLPSNCVYLKGITKKRYCSKTPKLRYEDVKDDLCEFGQITFKLANNSPHEGRYGVKDY